jgi:hypothetical protein
MEIARPRNPSKCRAIAVIPTWVDMPCPNSLRPKIATVSATADHASPAKAATPARPSSTTKELPASDR